jgi:uncharacterized protein YndB with AHSA1/START domain
MRATSVTTVNAPIDHVWEVLADHEGMSEWAPGLKATLSKPGAIDRNGVGAVRRLGVGLPAPVITEEIVEFEPGKRLGYKALGGVPLKNYQGEVSLREVPAGTEISYSVIVDKRLPFGEQAVAKAISKTLLSALARRARTTA